MTKKSEFVVLFQWPEHIVVAEDPRHALDALTLDQAKLQAAMLYAGAAFKATPPTGYLLLRQDREAYRYPPERIDA